MEDHTAVTYTLSCLHGLLFLRMKFLSPPRKVLLVQGKLKATSVRCICVQQVTIYNTDVDLSCIYWFRLYHKVSCIPGKVPHIRATCNTQRTCTVHMKLLYRTGRDTPSREYAYLS